jgi:hypothetical protein
VKATPEWIDHSPLPTPLAPPANRNLAGAVDRAPGNGPTDTRALTIETGEQCHGWN